MFFNSFIEIALRFVGISIGPPALAYYFRSSCVCSLLTPEGGLWPLLVCLGYTGPRPSYRLYLFKSYEKFKFIFSIKTLNPYPIVISALDWVTKTSPCLINFLKLFIGATFVWMTSKNRLAICLLYHCLVCISCVPWGCGADSCYPFLRRHQSAVARH